MPSQRHVAIVGAGQAAARTVGALRAAGYDGRLTLVGNESALPYERPPLSKEALFGDGMPTSATVFDADYYRAQDVRLALGVTAQSLDAVAGALCLADGTTLQADRIVLATGARPRLASLPGVDACRILTLRSIDDVQRLRPLLARGCRLVLVGGGFIGLEIAAGAVRLGCSVTVVEARPRLLERASSPHVSALLHALHTANGVDIRLGCTVVDSRQGVQDTELLLSDGSRCLADVIVAGIGAVPNDELARTAGIACSNGIEVDVDCRTSVDRIWAVGDVAARHHPAWGRRVRLESWDNAEQHAARAGRSIAASWNELPAQHAIDEPPPWFWTDQYDMNLQILGNVTETDRTVVRAGRDGNTSMVFHFRSGALSGAELVRAGRERPLVKKLLQAGWHLPPEKLGDSGTSLKELLATAQMASAHS